MLNTFLFFFDVSFLVVISDALIQKAVGYVFQAGVVLHVFSFFFFLVFRTIKVLKKYFLGINCVCFEFERQSFAAYIEGKQTSRKLNRGNFVKQQGYMMHGTCFT
eukprot:TRINITY_DN46034_c0_g2_i3.p7 TRINITY_DN46034_c0_g2~~TRINITY_DN46034_c0_g2_i3.p7  ORF type:complete len:105 (-),score=7.54 TRINITY_DN46034_c0_g2_i3:982-1296(-)